MDANGAYQPEHAGLWAQNRMGCSDSAATQTKLMEPRMADYAQLDCIPKNID
jgi:hypothetical protein